MDWSFHRFWRLRYLLKSYFHAIFPHVRKHKNQLGAERHQNWQLDLGRPLPPRRQEKFHAIWGQMGSNRIKSNCLNDVTQVLSSKFWLCNLFQTHTCSVFSVFVAQTCSCCYWQSTGLSSVSLLLWRIGSSILHRKLIGSFRLGIQ